MLYIRPKYYSRFFFSQVTERLVLVIMMTLLNFKQRLDLIVNFFVILCCHMNQLNFFKKTKIIHLCDTSYKDTPKLAKNSAKGVETGRYFLDHILTILLHYILMFLFLNENTRAVLEIKPYFSEQEKSSLA